MKELSSKPEQSTPVTTRTTEKRPFSEPQISPLEDVIRGNPAATSLFAVAGSGSAGN